MTKRWHLVTYDVRDECRLRRTAKVLEGYGERLQYSVFRCSLSARQLERLRWELGREMTDEDWFDHEQRTIGMFVSGAPLRAPGPRGEQQVDRSFMMWFNAGWLPQAVHLPENDWVQAGEVVLSGSLGPLVTVQRGNTYEATITGLGSVRASFEA